MVFNCCFIICFCSIYFIFEIAKVKAISSPFNIRDSYICSPSFSSLIKGYSLIKGRTSRLKTFILAILSCCCYSKIVSLIIQSVSIYMISFKGRISNVKYSSMHRNTAFICSSHSIERNSFTTSFNSFPSPFTQPFKILVID